MGGNRRSNELSQQRRVVQVPGDKAVRDQATQRGKAALDGDRVLSQGRAVDVQRMTAGRFPYNDWLIQKFNSISEVGLAEHHYDELHDSMNTEEPLQQLKEDARMLYGVANDISEDLDRVIARGEVLPDAETDLLLGRLWVCDQAKSVLIIANGSINIARKIGAFTLIGGFIAAEVVGKIALFRHRIGQLKALLEVAKQQTNKAWVKLVLNTSISAITMIFPHLGLATRGGLMLGQLFMDQLLGNPSAADQMRTTADNMIGAYDELEHISFRQKMIAKKTGGAFAVTGFVFDAQDVLEADDNVEVIDKLINDLKQEFKIQILPKISVMKNDLKKLTEEILPRLRMELAQNDLNASSARDELNARMEDTGYRQ